MKRIAFIPVLLMLFAGVFGQAPIVLQDGENVFIHSRLDTIIAHATDGSRIYLPGGNIILNSELHINKEVHIFGAGHYPDSSAATQVSFISGSNIRFRLGSSGSSITGIYFYNDLYFGASSNDTISFIDVTRCNLGNVYLSYSSSYRNSPNSNFRFSENVIRGNIAGSDVQYCLFEKNIIDGYITRFTQHCTFTNNVLNYYYYYSDVFSECAGLIVTNNIFTRDNHGLTASQLYNNIFSIAMSDAPGGTNLGSGNIGGQAPSATFVNFDGTGFMYGWDFHLKEGSPGIGGGTDGTDIGIYGTVSPYKPSAVPVNPHIRMVRIAKETDNGILPVEIHVGAQDK